MEFKRNKKGFFLSIPAMKSLDGLTDKGMKNLDWDGFVVEFVTDAVELYVPCDNLCDLVWN